MGVLVGLPAPDFTCAAVLSDGEIKLKFTLSEALKGKYGVVFFYPLDFTFVCPSEILAVNNRIDRFAELGVEVIGVSIDSHFTHKAWRDTPSDKGGIGQIRYTLAADIKHDICRAYDVESADGAALRGTFIIDKAGIVRAQMVNDLPLGRNVDEWIRLIEAWQFHEEHGEVCAAGWSKGDRGIVPSSEGIANYLADHAEVL